MKSFSITLLLIFTILTCNQRTNDKAKTNILSEEEIKSDKFFQYSIWWAFVNRVFDGDLKVSELKKHGNIGLGSFDFLDGELVLLNGIPYRIRENGEVMVASDNDEIVYANATFFDKDGGFLLQEPIDYEEFKIELDNNMPNDGFFYAYVIHGKFNYVKLGGVPKVEKPFKEGLDVLIPNRPIFEAENISGTLIGFYCPQFIGNINASGYHFHFISDDIEYGGHTIDFISKGSLIVEFDEIYEYQFQIPQNETYRNVKLEKEFQYNK